MQKIQYSEIINLGFKEEIIKDKVYFNQFGFDYAIITLQLTKLIYLDWAKDSQICKIIRTDKSHNILSQKQIKTFDDLKEIIDFFIDKK